MSKYDVIDKAVFGIFGATTWQSEGIKTFPSNFTSSVSGNEYIRVSIINGTSQRNQVSGQVLIEIFTPAGEGPKRATSIAGKLNNYLEGKSFVDIDNNNVQFQFSTLSGRGLDVDNKALHKSLYVINFNFFGA